MLGPGIVVLIAADGIGDQGTYDDILHLDGNANSNAIATYFKALMLGSPLWRQSPARLPLAKANRLWRIKKRGLLAFQANCANRPYNSLSQFKYKMGCPARLRDVAGQGPSMILWQRPWHRCHLSPSVGAAGAGGGPLTIRHRNVLRWTDLLSDTPPNALSRYLGDGYGDRRLFLEAGSVSTGRFFSGPGRPPLVGGSDRGSRGRGDRRNGSSNAGHPAHCAASPSVPQVLPRSTTTSIHPPR